MFVVNSISPCFLYLVQTMKAQMEAIDEFKGAFYIHNMHGVKDESVHDPLDAQEVSDTMDQTC